VTEDVKQLRLVVTVDDFDAAVTFYRDQLGLPEEAAFSSPDTRVSILSAGRATLEIADRGHAAFVDEVEVGRRVAGQVRVAFEVAHPDATTDRLARAGARVVAPPTLTPWQSVNARLDGPGPLHLTVFADARDEAPRRDEAELMVGRVVPPDRVDAPVLLVEPDPSWPAVAAARIADIRAALGDRVLLLEHVGSTSVPGLAAKPVIDLVLAVRDPVDEDAYVGPLAALGYDLRIREPDWHQHRMLKLTEPAVNLHVFRLGSVEIDRMLLFRDHLRADPDDLAFYQRTKRGLARRTWDFVQQYADAKSAVVEEIVARAARRTHEPLVGVHVLLAEADPRAADLARRLAVPLLDVGTVRATGVDAATAPAVVAAIAAGCPASVLVGAVPTDGLAGRVLRDPDQLPRDVDELARAVRQLAVYSAG
jgi:GrpB-like predicted nucleotidyltransferase (UPF0157 family)/predicted enzyme related to lactoylglutathione lyase